MLLNLQKAGKRFNFRVWTDANARGIRRKRSSGFIHGCFLLAAARGGSVTLRKLLGMDSYAGSENNGIESSTRNEPWMTSFVFQSNFKCDFDFSEHTCFHWESYSSLKEIILCGPEVKIKKLGETKRKE